HRQQHVHGNRTLPTLHGCHTADHYDQRRHSLRNGLHRLFRDGFDQQRQYRLRKRSAVQYGRNANPGNANDAGGPRRRRLRFSFSLPGANVPLGGDAEWLSVSIGQAISWLGWNAEVLRGAEEQFASNAQKVTDENTFVAVPSKRFKIRK